MSRSNLFHITYYNATQEIRLSAYADTIVFEQVNGENIIRAIRIGGYPEVVHALSDAIYAGGRFDVEIVDDTYSFKSESKRYERQFTHDGVYAEATLLGKDDDQKAKNEESGDDEETEARGKRKEPEETTDLPPRKCIIFCPKGDRNRLFEEVDRKTAVPLIPEFQDYILSELEKRGIQRQLTVVSVHSSPKLLISHLSLMPSLSASSTSWLYANHL